ncbi:MAG: FmdB family zinc ribbon protein [Phycisphaerales bacterium JB037]
MPTYDYRCKECGEELEVFQSITAKPKRKCPSCGRMALERLIGTGAAVLFKGSGFYQTDYRSESYKKGAKADAPSSDAGSSGGEKGSDKGSSKNAKPDAGAKPSGDPKASKAGKPAPAKKN